MYSKTTAQLTADGFTLQRGEGQRVQFWMKTEGEEMRVVIDTVGERAWDVQDDGAVMQMNVSIGCAAMETIDKTVLLLADRNALKQIILDGMGNL